HRSWVGDTAGETREYGGGARRRASVLPAPPRRGEARRGLLVRSARGRAGQRVEEQRPRGHALTAVVRLEPEQHHGAAADPRLDQGGLARERIGPEDPLGNRGIAGSIPRDDADPRVAHVERAARSPVPYVRAR